MRLSVMIQKTLLTYWGWKAGIRHNQTMCLNVTRASRCLRPIRFVIGMEIIILNLLGVRFSEWIAVGITMLGLLMFGFYKKMIGKTQPQVTGNQPPSSPVGQP